MALLPEVRLVLANTIRDPETECWTWTGATNGIGYGQMRLRGRTAYVHRVACREQWGPIPKGWHVDHLCRNTLCCNPLHLEAVTVSENVRRGITGAKTHCKHGHEFTPDNTYMTPFGHRCCRSCKAARERARRQTRKAA